MSGNSSATGGYLKQLNTPLSDNAVEDMFHDLVQGVLGLPADLIRPRWQPQPPRQPESTVDWCALGITTRTPWEGPYIKHINGGPDRLTRWSGLTMLVSFYGPSAQTYAEQLRDALYIGQNREQMLAMDINVTDAGEIATVPELLNAGWINRADLPVRLTQSVSRDYNVLDVASSEGTITTDRGVDARWDTTTVIPSS